MKYIWDDWSLFLEGAKSLQLSGDNTQWEVGIRNQHNGIWRWDLEYVNLNLPNALYEGGRGSGEVQIPVSGKEIIRDLSLRVTTEDLQTDQGNWLFDLGTELDLFLRGASKVWVFFHTAPYSEWMLEGGISWQFKPSLGFYAYRHEEKMRIAAASGVATEMANGHLPVAEYDWVVDATGSPDGLRQAIAMVRPRGTVILKSTVHGAVAMDTAPIIVNEVTLVGSRCGRFETAIPLLDHALIRTEEMIAARFPLRDAAQAFERAAQRGVLKVLLEAR